MKKTIINPIRNYKFFGIGLLIAFGIILKSCNPFQCNLTKEDIDYVYPENVTVSFLENHTDTIIIIPKTVYSDTRSSTVFFPDVYAEEVIRTYFETNKNGLYVGLSRIACSNYTSIKVSLKDSSDFALNEHLKDTAFISDEISILNNTYTNYWKIKGNEYTYAIKNLVYNAEYGILQLELEDGYTLELIEIKEED